MSKLEKRIHDEKNGLDYVLVGDYYKVCLYGIVTHGT